jgi:hypothetical protein
MPEIELKLIVPTAIAVVSLLVSLAVALRNWRYSEKSVRYTSRNQYTTALFDIDRQLVNRPELWAIYDDHPMSASRSNEPEAVSRRQAFLYFHFNLFETVYNDYNKILPRTRTDEQYWRSWDAWIRHFFRASSEARSLFADAMSQDVFFGDFVVHINEVIGHMAPPREPLSPSKATSAAGAADKFDTRARMLAALLDAHHTTFYTVISVIQATCFGFLVLVCFEEGAHYGVSQWLLAANTLVIIILVWNGFVRGFIVLSYVPKLVDGAMPFALGVAQCFAAYFAAHDVRGWYWSIAALSFIGFIGYVNAEVNARFNPEENEHVMVFYGHLLRMLQFSALFLAVVCGGIAYLASRSNEILTLLSFAVTAGYAVGDEVFWLRLERFARGID